MTPALSITGISPSSGMVGTFVTITGTLFGAAQGTSTVGLNAASATIASWSDTNIVVVVPAGASSGAFSVTVNGQVVTSPLFTVTSLPSGWADTDVGTVYQAGSATFSGGTFTVTGAGGGTWGTPDAMNFAYQTLVGDGSIVARLASLQNSPYAAAEAGVMIRETLDPGSPDAVLFYWDGDVVLQSRATEGAGGVVNRDTGGGPPPVWLQLVRVGNAFTGYTSSDGVNWTQIGTSMTIAMPQTVCIGLIVSGGGSLEPGTFDSVSINSTATPAPAITSLSPTTASIGSQVQIAGTNFGASQGESVVLLNGNPITVSLWDNAGIVFTVPAGATSGPVVVSVGPSMNDSNPVNLEVTGQPLPTSWSNQDVGLVGTQTGSATFSGGTFTVTGGGTGIGGTADAMQFAYQSLVGDGSIIARLTNVQENPYGMNTQAAVMIRETLNADAAEASVLYGWDDYLDLQDRPSTGAASNQIQGLSIPTLPEWLELVRTGNTFTGFGSFDGVNWTELGSVTIPMAQTVYIGLAVSGSYYLEPATFDSVSINSAANPAPAITGLSPTTASIGTQVEITGNNFGAAQGGSLVLLNGIPVTINLWSNTSIVFTIPVGATSGQLVVSVAPSMNDSNPVTLGVTSQPLPSPWLDQDVGAVGTLFGSATYSSGTFTVAGAGAGIGGTADAMHFVYQSLVGDGSIVARMTSLQENGGSFPQGGVMIRETLNPGAADASVFQGWNTAVFMQDRPTTGASVVNLNNNGTYGYAPPMWLQLVRAGNTFTGYVGSDGVNWTQLGTATVVMAQTVYIGLAVSGDWYLGTATFDNLSVTVGTTPFISSVSPIVGTIGASVTITGSTSEPPKAAALLALTGRWPRPSQAGIVRKLSRRCLVRRRTGRTGHGHRQFRVEPDNRGLNVYDCQPHHRWPATARRPGRRESSDQRFRLWREPEWRGLDQRGDRQRIVRMPAELLGDLLDGYADSGGLRIPRAVRLRSVITASSAVQ